MFVLHARIEVIIPSIFIFLKVGRRNLRGACNVYLSFFPLCFSYSLWSCKAFFVDGLSFGVIGFELVVGSLDNI